MFKIYCEWDIGHEDIVFKTKKEAEDWAKEALVNCGIEEPYEDVLADGLIGYKTVAIG
jgi:hypothetical protein